MLDDLPAGTSELRKSLTLTVTICYSNGYQFKRAIENKAKYNI